MEFSFPDIEKICNPISVTFIFASVQVGLPSGAIAGIVVAVVGLALAIIIGTFCCIRHSFSAARAPVSFTFGVPEPSVNVSYDQPGEEPAYAILDDDEAIPVGQEGHFQADGFNVRAPPQKKKKKTTSPRKPLRPDFRVPGSLPRGRQPA